MQWELSLVDFITKSLSILREDIDFDEDLLLAKVLGFFRERYKNMMLGSGHESDLIDAVLSVGFDHVGHIRSRIEHLKRFTTESGEFQSLALTFKRVTNILRREEESLAVDTRLFQEACETRLWEVYLGLKDSVYALVEKRNYFEVLNLLVRLRKPVDDLFDEVEILTKDSPQLRANRVGMLQNLARLFLTVADFSKFSI
jgi:glycyl-tRNA synthetase beta chain